MRLSEAAKTAHRINRTPALMARFEPDVRVLGLLGGFPLTDEPAAGTSCKTGSCARKTLVSLFCPTGLAYGISAPYWITLILQSRSPRGSRATGLKDRRFKLLQRSDISSTFSYGESRGINLSKVSETQLRMKLQPVVPDKLTEIDSK